MMKLDPDFRRMIHEGFSLATVVVLYAMPDQKSLVNEFMWQTLDIFPKYPRINKFLSYWRSNIEADILEVKVACSPKLAAGGWRNGIYFPDIL